MVKVGYQQIPPEYSHLIKQVLVQSDRFIIPRLSVKTTLSKRRLKKAMKQKTVLPILSPIWASFSLSTKALWTAAGLENGMTGWKHFVREYILRDKYGYNVNDLPSIYHQGKIGVIILPDNNSELIIEQDHPFKYWVSAKVRGTKTQREPKIVTEFATFPFILKINYHSKLVVTKANARARIFIHYISNYQGRDIETMSIINFDLQTYWKTASVEVNEIFGKFRVYKIVMDFYGVKGQLWFDNIKVIHSGRNWARDTACNDIHQDFTKAFYQVSKNWIASHITSGVSFESDYKSNTVIE